MTHKSNCASQSITGGQGLEFIECDCRPRAVKPQPFWKAEQERVKLKQALERMVEAHGRYSGEDFHAACKEATAAYTTMKQLGVH